MNGAIALAAAAACLLSAAATPPLRRLALRWDLTDRPGGHKAHHHPTPYLGGIAIVLSTVVPTAAALGFSDRRITVILLAATAVAALGLIDDVASLPVVTRLTAESLAAGGVVLSGVHITLTHTWVDKPITVMWIVLMTNSFNLLDNMDGALGTVGTVTAAFLGGAALVDSQQAFAVLLGALAFACLGFLAHNWPPAKIFMGDSGSLFIGFILTCSAIVLVAGESAVMTVSGLLLWTFVAVVDTIVVIVSRIRSGRSPLSGGTDHVSHRLRRIGLGARTVPATLGMITALPGALCLAVALSWVPPLTAAIVVGGIATILISLLQGISVYTPAPSLENLPKITERRR
ncbi:MraY family glycosyltransferase [Sphaerisporangium sp. NPDC088356]|uniref:MraY family glycosyltransferase n=1 Tax=Sphaerisporangium sp. NPDC088356 TaxID=3154871 RepID=UPI003429786A